MDERDERAIEPAKISGPANSQGRDRKWRWPPARALSGGPLILVVGRPEQSCLAFPLTAMTAWSFTNPWYRVCMLGGLCEHLDGAVKSKSPALPKRLAACRCPSWMG